jgi:hypothetical protein
MTTFVLASNVTWERFKIAVGLVLEASSTKHLTLVTGSVTVGCRSVRYYCKTTVLFLKRCTVAVSQGLKKAVNLL